MVHSRYIFLILNCLMGSLICKEGKVFIESIKNNSSVPIIAEVRPNPKNPFKELPVKIAQNMAYSKPIELGTFSIKGKEIIFTEKPYVCPLNIYPAKNTNIITRYFNASRGLSYEILKINLVTQNGEPSLQIQWDATPPSKKGQPLGTRVQTTSCVPANYKPRLKDGDDIKFTIVVDEDWINFSDVSVLRLIDFNEEEVPTATLPY